MSSPCKASFCVHTYDEADALRRLVRSSLPFAHLIAEWVVVDHRSGDATPQVCMELADLLAGYGIPLRVSRETRDLSAAFTFADLRNQALAACTAPVIALHDADFILGPAYGAMLQRAMTPLLAPQSRYHAASFTVPVVWDRLEVDATGVIRDHGRVWVHQRRARFLVRGAVRYEQTKDGGRWERLVASRQRPLALPLTPKRDGQLAADSLVSVNVKPRERIALRDTMTMFMQDAVQGKVRGGWLEAYRAGHVRSQGDYDYQDVNLRGWRLHTTALNLGPAVVA